MIVDLKLCNRTQRCLYFQKVDNIYLITHGFTKKTQKTPKKEIAHAQHLMKQYKER
ncbi:type II toxin-antitoxin system RelE/ParE family toxin [Fundicoccus sp. Sow4_H7]|uniref:type II toxin-antitoxin system RelE/ParE family toxin n=1 Tax=Fundicoccus sp. Sow4_H7 TaxID=3438784 RepID=UPI003F8EA992